MGVNLEKRQGQLLEIIDFFGMSSTHHHKMSKAHFRHFMVVYN